MTSPAWAWFLGFLQPERLKVLPEPSATNVRSLQTPYFSIR